MGIKVKEGLPLSEVVAGVERGDRWAWRDLSRKYDWSEDSRQDIGCLLFYLGEGCGVALIDDTQPENIFESEEWDWGFFAQYSGLPLLLDNVNIFSSVPIERSDCTLRESPWYAWLGGECPVPGNVEVEIDSPVDVYGSRAYWDKATTKADNVRWSMKLFFRLTGRVL